MRFNYNASRATNGPMLFFTNPSAMIDLCEEIRGAIDSRLCFYAYRRPGDMMVSFGSSECCVDGIGIPGFVISPFDTAESSVTIPWKPLKKDCTTQDGQYEFPSHSTTKEEYAFELNQIREVLEKQRGGKIVAARAIVGNRSIDPAQTFAKLCRNYPSAFVFAFSTPKTGCWIGATPELLLRADSNGIHSMALAGTRKAASEEEWDEKNKEEQQMVADYIVETFHDHGFIPDVEPAKTVVTGGIEHICTPISSVYPADYTSEKIGNFLKSLSPTPAVCGFPKESALLTIKACEQFSRVCYGGYCGPFAGIHDFTFHVTLRCARIEAERFCIYAGGGITIRSDINTEWTETEMKAENILQFIEFR